MSNTSSAQKRARVIAAASMLIAIAYASFMAYQFMIHRPESGGPVDRWIAIAFERQRLAWLESQGVLITADRYESEVQRLSKEEQTLVFDADFPSDMGRFTEYLRVRDPLPTMPAVFWIVFISAILTCFSAVSWLQGFSDGIAVVRSDVSSLRNDETA